MRRSTALVACLALVVPAWADLLETDMPWLLGPLLRGDAPVAEARRKCLRVP
jgi:hypothetical protein